MALTVLTGLLLYIHRRPAVFFLYLAINCWMWMNASWTISGACYFTRGRGFVVAGVISIVVSAVLSSNIRETLTHLRRIRLRP